MDQYLLMHNFKYFQFEQDIAPWIVAGSIGEVDFFVVAMFMINFIYW